MQIPQKNRNSVILAFVIAVSLLVAWFIRNALLIIYVSAVFAVVLKPCVDWLHEKSFFGWRPGRAAALLLLVLLLCGVLGALLAIAVPSIVSNVAGFSEMLASQSGTLQKRIHSIPILKNVDLAGLQSQLSSALGSALPAVSSTVTDIVTGILLTAYLILDGSALLKRALGVFPPDKRGRLESTLNRAADRMRRWLAGQAMLMAILGGSAALAFGIMGLPYFYLLALFAGVANIVPMLGPLVTVVVASAVALTQSVWDVLGVIIFYLIYQQVENAFLTPNIMKSQVQLSSAVVIIALLVGGDLAGIAGALVAVPSAVLAAELADEYLRYKPQAEE